MKRSLRLPFSLLFAVAVLALLSFRAAFLRLGFRGYSPELYVPLNETLLRLSADDPGEAALQKDAKNLLDGNLPSAARRRGIHRHPHETPSRIRRRSPKDYSRALRDWLSSRRFQPAVMEELITQVKGAAPAAAARYTSCAVVGNSGILLRRDDGDLIDGHEIVIRLNNARITGYQRHTGSKTSISFINSNILHLCARRNGCYCHPYGDIPIVMITKYYSLKRFVRETGRPPEEWSKVHDELMFHYSSGMQAVMLALGICDQVSVFGFGKSPEARHHYHTNQKAELDLHDYEAEYEFYGDLVERPQTEMARHHYNYQREGGARPPRLRGRV